MVFELTRDEFRTDLDRSLEALDACGVRPRGYRAPSFTITPPVHEYLEVLRECRFGYDCSVFPVRHPRYGQPGSPRRAFLLEPAGSATAGEAPFVVVPMPTWRVAGVNLPFSGGGYMRLLPGWVYRAVRAGARRQGMPSVIYLHPWELDDFRPVTGQGLVGRWRSQVGQGSMGGKLEELLRRGRFRTLGGHVDDLLASDTLPRRCLPLSY
ncbi:hypothetical protein DRQ50_14045 [bacterium]|nr:MAG: hypothetical protein DRQ50_14045 [bacterium]